jgi:hypothetical protein
MAYVNGRAELAGQRDAGARPQWNRFRQLVNAVGREDERPNAGPARRAWLAPCSRGGRPEADGVLRRRSHRVRVARSWPPCRRRPACRHRWRAFSRGPSHARAPTPPHLPAAAPGTPVVRRRSAMSMRLPGHRPDRPVRNVPPRNQLCFPGRGPSAGSMLHKAVRNPARSTANRIGSAIRSALAGSPPSHW